MKDDIEKRMVWGIIPTTDGKPPIIMLGIPQGAWNRLKHHEAQTIDMTRHKIPLRVMVYGGQSHKDCLEVIEKAARSAGIAIIDERRDDHSIKFEDDKT